MAGIDLSGTIRSSIGIGLSGIAARGICRVGLGYVHRVGARDGWVSFDWWTVRSFGHRDLRDRFQLSGLGDLRVFPLPGEEPASLNCTECPLGEGRRGSEFFQGPACSASDFQAAECVGVLQAQRTGKGDHGSVVRAVFGGRPKDLLAVLF